MTSYKPPRKASSKLPQSTLDHFASQPWLRPTLDDTTFQTVPMSRTVTHEGKGHTLMAKTWNTPETITELLSFYRPSKSPASLFSFPQSEMERAEVRRFYTFGGDLNAHPDLLHGGVISCLLDSSLGGAIGLALQETAVTNPMFTVQLNVTYKKPVRTPGTVMVRSWVTNVEEDGRKAWAYGVVEGEGGVVHATAEGMWLSAKKKKKGGNL